MRQLATVTLALALAMSGCRRGHKRTQAAPPAGQGEVTAALASLEQSLTTALAARRTQRCPRPAAPAPAPPAPATPAPRPRCCRSRRRTAAAAPVRAASPRARGRSWAIGRARSW